MMTLKIKEIKLTVAFCIFCSFFFPQTVGKFPKSRNHDSQPLGEMICKLMVEHESFTYRKHCIHIHLLINGKEEHLYVFWSICSCEMWKSCSTRVVVPSFTISISCKTCCQNIKYITHSNTGRCFNTIFAIPSNENDSWPVVAPGIWKALLL